MKKRAQFFILAAVIISAIVISFGVTINHAKVNSEPEHFYDYTYEVKRETGAVIDYEIYTNVQGGGDLEEFVSLLAADIKDRDGDANFMFIYGDDSKMTIQNYGRDDAYAEGQPVSGGATPISSIINYGGTTTVVEDGLSSYDNSWTKVLTEDELRDADSIDVEVNGQTYEFPISKYRQVIFIIQKDVGDESYIDVK